jgi:2,5-dioxopentanoate dehydrogenase
VTHDDLTGEFLLAGEWVRGTEGSVHAIDPATGERLDPPFGMASTMHADLAANAAREAFAEFRRTTPQRRAEFLELIADNIDARHDLISERAQRETGLPPARLDSEILRTTGQLRLFADLLRDGLTSRARIDSALPGRTPPRPELRQQWMPVGPVAVFGSSNFPLAFSNAGGDTAAALAAGCPVIVKTHSAHPGTAMIVSRAIADAAAFLGLPAGVYSALIGSGSGIGAALVAHPAVRAVGFTGSRAGGLALMEIARSRPEPIPVYAEMSSVNPVVVMPSALTDRDLASGYVQSLTLGAGQFCTNPGLMFVPRGAAGDSLVDAIGESLSSVSGQTMLTPGIREAFERELGMVASSPGVSTLAVGQLGSTENAPAPRVLTADAALLGRGSRLASEMFGAAGMILRYDDVRDLPALLSTLEGQLTATIRSGDPGEPGLREVVEALELIAGRLILNGWPTGVEVSHAMVHGGPFPATSDGRSTSVGTLAIERFQRPITYQGFPDALLPVGLTEGNPSHEVRWIDGSRSSRQQMEA